jgi:predicted PhzF superfamily epimerase YddE/YHI9
MGIRITQVDAFTDRPFAGNPAAVCILPAPREDAWMHDVAREMNLSETAFLVPRPDGYDLRWMTPAIEVDLCGHATLASAHVLWEEGYLAPGAQARFHTRSGLLLAERRCDWIELDFPATPAEPAPPPPGLLESLGIPAVFTGRTCFDYFVEAPSAEAVRALDPDFTALGRISARGVIVTAPSDTPEYDFISRFFAPSAGVNEDPVTGSAHACLAPYWLPRLDKPALVGYQASARGGVIRVRMESGRVRIGGQAVTVLHAELVI